MIIRFFLFLVFSIVIAGTDAVAKNWEVRSENFILITDESQKSGENIIKELEDYRRVILSLWTTDPVREIQPVRIYALNNSDHIEQIIGRTSKNLGGIYTTNRQGPIFVLNWQGGPGERRIAEQNAKHEYTHHLMFQYTKQVFPRWYHEGFAEYTSSLEKKGKNTYVMGRPPEGRMVRLHDKTWAPMDIILGAVRKYPYKSGSSKDRMKVSQFYAQSWLAFAYIQSQAELSRQTPEYVGLISEGRPALEAFETAYGVSPEEFEVQLKKFHKRDSYPSIEIKTKDTQTPVSLTSREVSAEEFEFHLADGMFRFNTSRVSRAKMLAQFEKAEAVLGMNSEIAVGKVRILSAMKDYDQAIAIANEALSHAPEHSALNHAKGMALYRYSLAEKPQNTARMEEAQSLFKKAIKANPENMQAHYDYVRTFRALKQEPDKQAVASAKYVLSYYRALRFITGNLGVAEVLIASDEHEAAKPPIEKAIIWGRVEKTRTRAEKLKSKLEMKLSQEN